MAYVSNHRKWFRIRFPKEENLIDYVNRLYDLPKKEFFDGLYKHFGGAFFENLPKKGNLMDYISRLYNLPKSENGEQVEVLT